MKKWMHLVDEFSTEKRTDIEGMSRIGELSLRGSTFEVYVNTDDAGKIPHFHVRDKNDWKLFHTCVRIDSPEYFHHGDKTDVFNSRERKALQEFMCSPTRKKLFKEDSARLNNWEYTCILWDENNSDVEISDGVTQPDYTELS